MRSTSRGVTSVVVVAALGSYFFVPETAVGFIVDFLVRTYLMFVGGVMAHEAVHGNLASTKRANLWWGRLALLPSSAPYATFHMTHRFHHAHTNVAEDDPDYFIKPKRFLEVPFRCVALPHYWVGWIRGKGMMTREAAVEIFLNYAGLVAVYCALSAIVGFERVLYGLIPAGVLASFLLWYFFAVMTHEETETGEAAAHNYYGRVAFWLSLGLSMHGSHHERPTLPWLSHLRYVEPIPESKVGFGIPRNISP